jgi:hypothetical protein
MPDIKTPRLQECIRRYRSTIPGLESFAERLDGLPPGSGAAARDPLTELYEELYPLLEQALWTGSVDFHSLLDCYQSLFREQDALIRQGGDDKRHHFLLSIPVADRPQHLQACLESIFQVCRLFGYGGNASGAYGRIRVIVAEDSRDEANIRQHLELVEAYRQKGLQVIHLGQAEQYELLHSIPPRDLALLGNILTTQPRERFYLKGQAANRNLSYLKFLQLTENRDNTLYYLVDSDQSFCVNRQTDQGEEVVYALNYFHYIDRIFRTTDTRMLTGKLVGDPPVSPAVMAANFLDDVTAFFASMANATGSESCGFHAAPGAQPGDAAYHDMANLFGFENQGNTFAYRCRLQGEHDHQACLNDFAARLNSFFFGEHLTRRTFFSYSGGFGELAPARTIYPGNYIVNYAGLKYIIPFGNLRLRMSGPTAGRLIQAETGARFASVNLPHLHRRTTDGDLSDDFRPGVEMEQEHIDLSNEFERQFFGDLMLFSVLELASQIEISEPFPEDRVVSILERKEAELLELYQQKHEAILEKNRLLNELVFDAGHWWLNSPGLATPLRKVEAFIHNIKHNFGDQSLAYQQIHSQQHRAQRKRQITEALLNYRTERDAWDRLF